MNDKRLIPCPFCGCEKINLNKKIVGSETLVYYAVCKSCGTIGPKKTIEESAIRMWNRRMC